MVTSTDPVELGLAALTFHHVIDGQLVENQQFDHRRDPRTNAVLWKVPVAGQHELEAAVTAAQNAFRSWSKTSFSERQNVMRQLTSKLRDSKALIAAIVSKETGKSAFMSELEVDHSIAFLEFNSSQQLLDETIQEDTIMKIVKTHSPLGIVAAICPWNFPLVLAVAKVAAALVTGNCVIVKPSPFTPYSILKFAEIARDIIPSGIFQALNGNNTLGEHMTTHPGIDKVSFTGSTATGKKIMESASRTLKRITLELGGNDATIVCPDVDVKKAASEVANGCFFNAGQMCVATKRVYVHEDVYNEFRREFLEAVKAFSLKSLPDLHPIFGPIQNHMQYAIVQEFIQDCKTHGYQIVTGGDAVTPGLFIEPTVVDNPPDNSRVVKDEQFGPIIPLLSWKEEDEVVRRANHTETGLGACVWAKDRDYAEHLGRRLEVGSVWINSYEKPNPVGYFSGHKQSGIGGEWGRQGLLSYCNTQILHIYK
ncbi:Aldehyde/histidinol dehydrogenase [Aspergillus sergii]|uniref:aldehyde dehydrogenase (NAD(+)) n=1 Tax=Aspergillus sergii TaxID=1034303 RepID=A0A5N6X221_9EURO|nr:Aldehyde/histidinol dehydrogenase [Aspergillus sergii]